MSGRDWRFICRNPVVGAGALRGDGSHIVSLNKVIKTMKEAGADRSVKHEETTRGGLAVNIEC